MPRRAPPPTGPTDEVTSNRMKSIRRGGTKPELIVRQLFRSHGIFYRCNCRDLPGSPDLANRSKGWAVFVHGCFWHGHGGCAHATVPKRNRAFWLAKIEANRRRDEMKEHALRRAGLSVAVVWECEVNQLLRSTPHHVPPALSILLRRPLHREAPPPRGRHRPT
jgi:DNA mismatch endonuclease (patch repair protein)